MTGKELEKEIGMKSTYASKYKTEPEKARYDKHRHILQLLEMPRAKGDKWINPYGKQTKKPLNDDGVL